MKTVGEVIDEVCKIRKTIDELQDVICGRIKDDSDVCDEAIVLLANYLDMLREIPIKK